MSYADRDEFFTKYDVRYKETGETVEGPLFTLAFSRDPHARVALAAYARSCEAEMPGLAADLRAALKSTE